MSKIKITLNYSGEPTILKLTLDYGGGGGGEPTEERFVDTEGVEIFTDSTGTVRYIQTFLVHPYA